MPFGFKKAPPPQPPSPQPAQRPVVTPFIRVDHQYADGDVLLVSSDKKEFKVHSYHLKAASPKFARVLDEMPPRYVAAGETADLHKVELVDPFERTEIVELLLDSIYGVPWRCPWQENNALYRDLVKLFDKWELKRCREALLSTITSDVSKMKNGYYGVGAFILAALLDDPDLASNAMRITNDTGYPVDATYQPPTLNERLEGYPSLVLGSWSYATYRLIPPRYAHALLRASLPHRAGYYSPGMMDFDKYAEDFKELMTDACVFDQAGG